MSSVRTGWPTSSGLLASRLHAGADPLQFEAQRFDFAGSHGKAALGFGLRHGKLLLHGGEMRLRGDELRLRGFGLGVGGRELALRGVGLRLRGGGLRLRGLGPRLRLLQQSGVARVRDAGRLEQRVLLALDRPGFLPGRLRGPKVRVALGADRRDLFGGDSERLELRVAIGAQRVGLFLRGAERCELASRSARSASACSCAARSAQLRVAVGANRFGLLLRAAKRVELRVAVGANRLGLLLRAAKRVEMGVAFLADGVRLPRGLFQRVGQRRPFELAGRALFLRFGAHGVELLLGFDAIELEARLGFLERERACGARRRARFFAGRVRQPLDQLADGSGVGDAGAGERGSQRLAAHVDGDTERFELGQRRLGGLRNQGPKGCGGLGLRVVVERRGGVVWCRRRKSSLRKSDHSKATRGPEDREGISWRINDCKVLDAK